MRDNEAWRIAELRVLYTEIVNGNNAIFCQQDASDAAAVLRLLADELDPKNKGNLEKAKRFIQATKQLMGYETFPLDP